MSLSFFITMIIIIVLCSIGIYIISKYNEITKINIKINDAEINIDETLREKYDLITNIIALIEKNSKIENKIFNDVKNLKSDKFSNFEVDRILTKTSKEIIKIADDHDKISKNKSFKSYKEKLKDIEEKLIALRTFYNKYTSKYNLLINTIPTNLIAKFAKFSPKLQYDGKNLNDKNIKDFKI